MTVITVITEEAISLAGMRRWGVGLLVALLALVLAAPAGLAQEFNWRQFEGTTLRILMNSHPWQKAIQPHLSKFEELTGMKVVAEVYPEDQFRAKVLVELASGVADIDVFMTMPAQEGLKYMRAGWLVPVDDFLNNPSLTAPDYDFDDFLAQTREAMRIEGRLIGPPVQVENAALMYRKDLFEKYGVKVPETLEELEEAARKLHNIEDGVVGFVARGRRAAATSMWAGMLHAMGGTWLDENRNPAINSPEAIAAFELWGKLLREYGPPGATGYHWYEASSLFAQGKAAMWLDANSLSPTVEDPSSSVVAGKVGYALYPKGPGGYGSTVAVWGLAIPTLSKNPEAAWLFMQWATSKEMVLAVQQAGVLGARESVWASPEGRAGVPEDLAESLAAGSAVGTPLWNPPVVAVAEVRDVVGEVIVEAILGGDVKAAADRAAREMKRIMDATE